MCFRSFSSRIRCWPTKPVPPVTSTRISCGYRPWRNCVDSIGSCSPPSSQVTLGIVEYSHSCIMVVGSLPDFLVIICDDNRRNRMTTSLNEAGAGAAGRRSRVLIFVVAYNAERTIQDVVGRIPASLSQYDTEVLIIDDSSSDATFARAHDMRVN